jgi:NADH-quinone oxidoreductase subunit G
VNWEGRGGSFAAALTVPGIRTDLYVLGAIADEMDVHLGLPDPAAARAELFALGAWKGARPAAPAVLSGRPTTLAGGRTVAGGRTGGTELRLATWHQLIDAGRLQDGEPYLAGTARPVAARVSPATADEAGLADGDKVTVATAAGAVTVPLYVTEMADGVVWLPTNSPGSAVRADLGAGHGSRVTLRRAE